MDHKRAWYLRNKERLKQEYREKNPVKDKVVKYISKENNKYIYNYDPAKRHEKHVRLYASQATIYKQQLRVEKIIPVKKEEVKKEYKIPIERKQKQDRQKIRKELTYEKDGRLFYNFNIIQRLNEC